MVRADFSSLSLPQASFLNSLAADVLGTLVRLSETDRPPGIQAEVLRAVSNMVVLLDEQFLVHSAVHKAVLRLLRNCVGDDLQEQLDGRSKLMGAARGVIRTQPSEHEEDCMCKSCLSFLALTHFPFPQWSICYAYCAVA